jgi:hypothetical protein
MGVGDHQLDAAQAALLELAQERGPERFRFGRPDVHAQHLAAAVAVDGDDHRGPAPGEGDARERIGRDGVLVHLGPNWHEDA